MFGCNPPLTRLAQPSVQCVALLVSDNLNKYPDTSWLTLMVHSDYFRRALLVLTSDKPSHAMGAHE